MKKLKRLLTIGFAVLLMFCMSISLFGCANGITPTPDKFYLLLEDTRGKQYKLHVEYEPDKTLHSEEKIYYAIEDTDVQIGFNVRGLYDSEDEKISDKRFYQETREEERSWAYPLNKAGTYDFLKVYYINKFNKKNVMVDTYIVNFKVQVVIY